MYSRGGRRGNSRGRDLAGGWRRGDTGSGDGEGNGMPSIVISNFLPLYVNTDSS
jgi:hypothetical protein